MALPIEATPVLDGDAADRFIERFKKTQEIIKSGNHSATHRIDGKKIIMNLKKIANAQKLL